MLEYCDWGSLRTALDAGAFFAEDNSLNYAAILDTAADVAKAMLHLHKNNVSACCVAGKAQIADALPSFQCPFLEQQPHL